MITQKKTLSFGPLSVTAVRKLIAVLLVFELILVALDIGLTYSSPESSHTLRQLFNLAREGSLGSWFSSTQLLLTGGVVWLVFLRFQHDANTKPFKKYAWALIALFFTFMAIDDAAAIHETIGSVYEDVVAEADEARDVIGGELLESYPSYPWQVILGPVFVFMGLFILVFLWLEFSLSSMRMLLLAALACYAVAVGLDYVEGLYGGYKAIIVVTSLDYDSVTHLSKVIEEFLEMLGTTLFLAIFVMYFSMHTEKLELKFNNS